MPRKPKKHLREWYSTFTNSTYTACGMQCSNRSSFFAKDITEVTCENCKRTDEYRTKIAIRHSQESKLHFKQVALPLVVPAGSYCFIEDTICDHFDAGSCKLNIGDPIRDVETLKYLKPIECFNLKEI